MRRCYGCMREFRKEFDVCPHCGYMVGAPASSKNYLEPGSVLASRYVVGKELGQGGFGITYIAFDEKFQKPVAIKEYFPNSYSTRTVGESEVSYISDKAELIYKEGKNKMLDEGRRLSKFSDNENIVNVYDVFEENNTAYIVMEYLEGKNLKQHLNENGGKLAPEEAVKIISPVLNALSDMHRSNMIHRDISPDNIFLCDNGNIKLLDFGSARLAVENSENSMSVIIKRGFAPKEQYMNRSKQGSWTDIYAVCATLYNVITGELPSDSMERDTEPLKSLSCFGLIGYEKLEKVLFKGLEPEIDDRIKTADELRLSLEKAMVVVGVSEPEKKVDNDVTSTKTADNPVDKPTGNKKSVIIILAVVILAALVALGFFLKSDKPEEEQTTTATETTTELLELIASTYLETTTEPVSTTEETTAETTTEATTTTTTTTTTTAATTTKPTTKATTKPTTKATTKRITTTKPTTTRFTGYKLTSDDPKLISDFNLVSVERTNKDKDLNVKCTYSDASSDDDMNYFERVYNDFFGTDNSETWNVVPGYDISPQHISRASAVSWDGMTEVKMKIVDSECYGDEIIVDIPAIRAVLISTSEEMEELKGVTVWGAFFEGEEIIEGKITFSFSDCEIEYTVDEKTGKIIAGKWIVYIKAKTEGLKTEDSEKIYTYNDFETIVKVNIEL